MKYYIVWSILFLFLLSHLYILGFPAVWVIFEWLRSFGPIGNVAGAIGYTQTSNPYVLQSASLVGVYGLSFLVLLLNAAIFSYIFKTKSQYRDVKKISIVLGLILVFVLFRIRYIMCLD